MDFNIAQHNPKTSVLFKRVKVRWILQIKAVRKMLLGREKQEKEERRLLGVTPWLWRRNLHCFIGLHRALPSWFVWEHWHKPWLGMGMPIPALKAPRSQPEGEKPWGGHQTKLTPGRSTSSG